MQQQRVQKKHKRTNGTWGKPMPLSEMYGEQNVCLFEQTVTKLGLQPEQYEKSELLHVWVKRNYKRKFVPEWLLLAWNLEIHQDEITVTV